MSLKSYSSVPGTLTKVRAEQIKSEDALGTLAGDLAALRGQVADIIGAADYKEEVSGLDVQLLDLAHHIKADVAASEMEVLHDMKVDGAAHVVGAFTADADALVKGAAEIVGAVKMDSSLALTGSATLKSSMSVAGLADFNGGVTANEIKIDGDAVGHLYLVGASGQIEDEANLSFAGSKLFVTGGLDVSAAAAFANGIAVNGAAADFNAGITANEIKIDGDTVNHLYVVGASGQIEDAAGLIYDGSKLSVTGIMSGSGAVQAASMLVDGGASVGANLSVTGNSTLGGTLSVTGAATMSSSLTVAGNLTVNGTTTTVNSTTITVDDKNIELGSVDAPTDVTAEGGGITLKGATDKTIVWQAANGWLFSEKIEAPSAKLNGDLTAVKGIFSGDVSGVKGTFSGDLAAVKGTFSGDVAAPHVAANNLHQNYVVLSDASHNLIDSANFTFDGSMMALTGTLAVQGDGGTSGNFKVGATATIKGSLLAQSGSVLSGVVNLPARNPMKILVSDGGKNVSDTSLSWVDIGAGQVELLVGSGSQQLHIDSGAKKLWSASDLTLSASNGVLAFADKTESIKLANDAANWTAFRAADTAYGSATSLLDCFLAIDSRFDVIAAGSAKKSVSSLAATVAGSAVTVTGPGSFAAADLTKDNSMVYFNGQLLRSGSVADLSGTIAADYSLDGGYASMKFSFDVEAGDIVVIQKV